MPTRTRNPRSNRPSRVQAYWPAAVWAGVILLLTGLPGENLPDINFWDLNLEDKLAHFFAFGVLGALMVFGGWKRAVHPEKWKRPGIIALVCAGLYGGITEILQGTVFVSRYPSFGDFVANVLGAGLGTTLAIFVLSKFGRK